MKENAHEILMRNVATLAQRTEREEYFLPDDLTLLPSVESVRRIVELIKYIIFTDYFQKRYTETQMRYYHIGVYMDELYRLLCSQIGQQKALLFIDQLPEIKRVLYTDVEAMFDADPAATNYGEVIFCYPVLNAMTHYRVAHALHQMEVHVIPRIITEQAHSKTGIDIHPGAEIGEYFAIDHGTGVVIGETCIIGSHVTLYQGVTLGAKSFKYDEDGNVLNVPRHPILEDYVTVYSNASILGRITIGHHSVIGGNIWLTNDVPPHSRILQSKAVDVSYQGGLGI